MCQNIPGYFRYFRSERGRCGSQVSLSCTIGAWWCVINRLAAKLRTMSSTARSKTCTVSKTNRLIKAASKPTVKVMYLVSGGMKWEHQTKVQWMVSLEELRWEFWSERHKDVQTVVTRRCLVSISLMVLMLHDVEISPKSWKRRKIAMQEFIVR